MAVSLNLTTKQFPVFKKAMKTAKISLETEGTTVELEKADYSKVVTAVQDAWFKEQLKEGASNEDILLAIINRLDTVGIFFVAEAVAVSTKEEIEAFTTEDVIEEPTPTDNTDEK